MTDGLCVRANLLLLLQFFLVEFRLKLIGLIEANHGFCHQLKVLHSRVANQVINCETNLWSSTVAVSMKLFAYTTKQIVTACEFGVDLL